EIIEGKTKVIENSQSPRFRYINGRILQDRCGDWFVGTEQGLFWFKGPELQLRNGRKLSTEDGIGQALVNSIYRDPFGRLWVSVGEHDLFYSDSCHAGAPHFNRISLGPNISSGTTRMVCDRSGTLWLAGGYLLARVKDGIVSSLREKDGLAQINPRSVFVDSRGWLWIGQRSKGVSVTRDPTAETPQFINYSLADGLASDTIYSVTEDNGGRIY